MSETRPTVLFVCVHNAGPQPDGGGPAAQARRRPRRGALRGLRPGGDGQPGRRRGDGGGRASTWRPEVPKLLETDAVRAADAVVTMGCGDACPIFPGKRYEDWELEDPAGRTSRPCGRSATRSGAGRARSSRELERRPWSGLTSARRRWPRASPRSPSSSPAAARSSPTPSTAGRSGAVGIALVFGLIIMVMVYATGHLSGAHINPAVTVAFALTRHFPAREAAAYVAAQVIGALAGALLLLAVWPDQPADLGATVPTRRRRQRARLRDRHDRVPDVRDHGRGDRHPRGRRRGGDRDRRHGRARRALRRARDRRLDEPGPLARPGARQRAPSTTSGSTSSGR